MSDRAEREKQLDWLYRLKSNLKIFIPKDFHLAEFEQSLDYAISSIKTDLKYDLLYEETKHIANVSKMIEPTTKNCRSCRNFGSHHGICEICKDNKCWIEKEPTTKNDLADGKDNNVTSKEDAISRQEAIDTIRQLYIDLATQKYVIDLLKVLPSVTPQETRWIPVSERLPEKNMECLVAVGRFNFTEIATYSDLMGIIDHKIFYQGDVGHDNFKNITQYVKAWMPLLKPYEPQESENKE